MGPINVEFYLVIGQRLNGVNNEWTEGKPSVRVCKSQPTVKPHEVAVFMHMRLPLGLFRRPRLQARIDVPDTEAPIDITPEIESNITRVLQEQLGITLTITAPTAPPKADWSAPEELR